MTDAANRAATSRARELEDLFTDIARHRMAGLPMLNPALRVEAIGFAPDASAAAESKTTPANSPVSPVSPASPETPGAIGVLITPWFMNLVWFPLARGNGGTGVGVKRLRTLGTEQFSFIGAYEERFGSFEACSMFSPMFEFADHAAAQAMAEALLSTLRAPPVQTAGEPVAARRAFLFGRSAVRTRDRAA